jgi:hypothetical protein
VLIWAKRNAQDCQDWMEELDKQKIREMEDLVERATYDDTWGKLTKDVSGGLTI